MIALFFDTETTGLPEKGFRPEIVQVAAVLQDTGSHRILRELSTIVKPEGRIPQDCIDIHGIDNDLAARFGVDPLIADNMLALMAAKADVIVAHNIQFDVCVLKSAWLISYAVIASKQQFCTMRGCSHIQDIPRRLAGGDRFARLTDVYRYFYGHDFEGAHDAMNDVRACRDIYFKLIEVGNDNQQTASAHET